MKLEKVLSIGVIALTALSLVTPNAFARPKSLYPCVVPATCSSGGGGATASFVSTFGVLALQLTGENFSGSINNVSGWEVFNSNPTVNPGNTEPNSTSFAPAGVYTFNVSGLPAGNNFLEIDSIDQFGKENYNDSNNRSFPITNGHVSVVIPTVSNQAQPTAVYFWIFNDNSKPLPTIYVSNFAANGRPLYLDTTHFDNNPSNEFSWCKNF